MSDDDQKLSISEPGRKVLSISASCDPALLKFHSADGRKSQLRITDGKFVFSGDIEPEGAAVLLFNELVHLLNQRLNASCQKPE